MNTSCALCGTPLTLMDTVLGENKLSDGGILCNKCLNKATGINQDLVHGLNNYSLAEIRDLIWGESIEEAEEVVVEPVMKTSVSRTTMTFSHTVRFSIDKPKPTRYEEIQEQIIALNTKLGIFVDNEVNELVHKLVDILDKEEIPIAIAAGRSLEGNHDTSLIATGRRVIIFNKSFFGSVCKDEFLHHNINNVLYSKGKENISLLKIYTDSAKVSLVLNNKDEGQIFGEAIKSYINSFENRMKNHPGYPKPEISKMESSQKENPSVIFDKLEKLGRLREAGILTEEEFAEQKKKLLARL